MQEGTGSVRFVSVPDFRQLFGSIRFGLETYLSRFDALRPVLSGCVVARSASVRFGSVRFVSASGSGRFQNETVRFDSVRFGRFG